MLTCLIRQYGCWTIPLPVVDRDVRIQSAYEAMRRKGTPHKLAEMLAARAAPMMGGSDRMFCEGSTAGKRYCSQIARYPGDRRAYVSNYDEAKAVAADMGMTIRRHGDQGKVIEGPLTGETERQFSDDYRVADDIVEDELFSRCVDNPELHRDLNAHPKKQEELRHEISDQLSGKGADDQPSLLGGREK